MLEIFYMDNIFYLNPRYIIWIRKDITVFKGRERYKIKLSKAAGLGYSSRR